MGGEDRVHLETGQGLSQPLLAQRFAELSHGGGQAVRQHGSAAVALAQRPRPLVLLGQVGEVEIAGEGARHLLRAFQRPAGDQALRRHLHGVVLAGSDHGAAETLHVLQELRAAPLAQDLPKSIAQEPDVAAQRLGHLRAGGGPELAHPRPMKGILVAITVMNCTLASSGRPAM
jgi:hypothetical protein